MRRTFWWKQLLAAAMSASLVLSSGSLAFAAESGDDSMTEPVTAELPGGEEEIEEVILAEEPGGGRSHSAGGYRCGK